MLPPQDPIDVSRLHPATEIVEHIVCEAPPVVVTSPDDTHRDAPGLTTPRLGLLNGQPLES